MSNAVELYVQEFKEWLKEMENHQNELEASIKAAEEKKILNEKQLELHKERIKIHIKEFNAWAKANGAKQIELP